MGLERAFLDDVIERPDDDAPRLVYADWLEDNGDPDRADFIRTQCRLAAKGRAGDPARTGLLKREKELLDAHAVRWAEPLRGMVSNWAFRRGFVDFVRLDRDHGLEIGALPALFRLAPLEGLALESFVGETVPALLRLESQLPRLRYLDLFEIDDTRASDLIRLIATPGLANLRALFLEQEYADEFPVDALSALAKSPALSRLAELGLAFGTIEGDLPPGVVRAIARSPYLRPVSLYLVNTYLASPLRGADLHLPTFQSLEALSLEGCSVSSALWRALLAPGSFSNLQLLRLSRVDIDENTRQALLARHGAAIVCFDAFGDADRFPRRTGHHWPSP